MGERVSLYVIAPSTSEKPIHELHDVLSSAKAAAMPGFFTWLTAAACFTSRSPKTPNDLELVFVAAGWTIVGPPA